MNTGLQERSVFSKGGPLLSEQLTRDQDYHKACREFLTKELSGWGIMDRLVPSITNDSVGVSHGWAISMQGELILLKETGQSEWQWSEPVPSDENTHLIAIRNTSKDIDDSKIPNFADPQDATKDMATAVEDYARIALHSCGDSSARKKSHELAENGWIVLGRLTYEGSRWLCDQDVRHDGPMHPKEGTSAFAVTTAIHQHGSRLTYAWLRAALARQSILVWFRNAAAALLLFLLVAYGLSQYHWYATRTPYRFKRTNFVTGPIRGESYGHNYFKVQVLDRRGWGIANAYVTFELQDVTTKDDTTDKVFFAYNQEANYPYKECIQESHRRITVRTDGSGNAAPPGIRFQSDATGTVDLTVRVPDGKPIYRHRMQLVEKKITALRVLNLTGTKERPLEHKVNEKIVIRVLLLNSENKPISQKQVPDIRVFSRRQDEAEGEGDETPIESVEKQLTDCYITLAIEKGIKSAATYRIILRIKDSDVGHLFAKIEPAKQ